MGKNSVLQDIVVGETSDFESVDIDEMSGICVA
jgi:hypothetical protein